MEIEIERIRKFMQLVETRKDFEVRCNLVCSYVQDYHDAGIKLGKLEASRRSDTDDYEGPLNLGVSYY